MLPIIYILQKMNLTLKELGITRPCMSRSDAKTVSSAKFLSIMARLLTYCQSTF